MTDQCYIAVKGSLHSTDSSVFGLTTEEIVALSKRFSNSCKEVINGILIKGSPVQVLNSLGELGYKVVCSSGETEIVWTLRREVLDQITTRGIEITTGQPMFIPRPEISPQPEMIFQDNFASRGIAIPTDEPMFCPLPRPGMPPQPCSRPEYYGQTSTLPGGPRISQTQGETVLSRQPGPVRQRVPSGQSNPTRQPQTPTRQPQTSTRLSDIPWATPEKKRVSDVSSQKRPAPPSPNRERQRPIKKDIGKMDPADMPEDMLVNDSSRIEIRSLESLEDIPPDRMFILKTNVSSEGNPLSGRYATHQPQQYLTTYNESTRSTKTPVKRENVQHRNR